MRERERTSISDALHTRPRFLGGRGASWSARSTPLRSRRPALRPLAFFAAALLQIGTALGASYIIPSDEALIAKSSIVVRGRVLEVQPVEDPGGAIRTEVTLTVDKTLKGSPASGTIVVVQPGGRIGDRADVYPGTGSFTKGDEVLVMLSDPASPGEAKYRVTDFALGNFRVLKDIDGREFFRREGLRDAHVVATQQEARAGADSAEIDPDRDAATFERYVSDVVLGIAKSPDYLLPPRVAGEEESGDRLAEFVFLGSPARWTQFEQGTPVSYRANAAGDPGSMCGPDKCLDEVATGVVAWNNTPSTQILMEYGGPDATIAGKCITQSPLLNNEIQFSDPCGEIANLSGCSGTLALGGFSSQGTGGGNPPCPEKGNPNFGKIMAGRISVNNGVGSCLSSCGYTEMMAHETGHSIGAGHTTILGSLMYPSIAQGFCGQVRTDDAAFAQCAYPQIELTCDLTSTQIWGGPPPMNVTLDAGVEGGVGAKSFTWDFGDGGTSSATEPSHTFASASEFTVSVTVTDQNDQTCTDDLTVTVQPCKAPRIKSVTFKFALDATWRAIVTGSRFKKGARVEIDSGSGYVPAPKTKFISDTKLQGRDVGIIWPPGQEVTIRVVNPNGCPSNPFTTFR